MEECELLRLVPTSTSAVATVRRLLRVGVVFGAVRVRLARGHAHRFMHRSQAMHRAGRDNTEESAVGHQPKSNQWNEKPTT